MIRQIDWALDFDPIKYWYECHGQKMPKFFPVEGLIVPDVAAVWIIRTDYRMMFIDPLISNPNRPRSDRDTEFAKLLKRVKKMADEEGYKQLVGLTKKQSVLNRGLDNGFKLVDEYNYLVYNLGER